MSNHKIRGSNDQPVEEDTDYGVLPLGVAAAIDALIYLSKDEVMQALLIARNMDECWGL